MATERLTIEINEKGARVVQRGIAEIGKTATAAEGGVTLLRRALGALGAVAVFRGLIRTLASFSQEMSTLKAIAGANEEQFRSLREEVRRLGAETRFSATQAAEGATFLARAGFDTNQVLESLEDTLKLAQAGSLDLASAADIASNVLQGFRLEVDQTSRVVDVLAFAANNSNTNVLQLGTALKFVAPVAAGVGVSIEETAAAIGALSDAGLQASLAGTGLRRTLSELESPSAKTIKILSQLGLKADEVKISEVGLTKALITLRDAGVDTGLALEIFGDRGGPAFEVLSTSIPKVQAMNEELKKSAGFASEVAKVMDENLNGALLANRSAIEAVVISFGDLGAEGLLTDSLFKLADAIRFVANNLEAFAAGAKVLLLGTVVPAFRATTRAVISLNLALLANPLIALLVVIAALVTAFKLFAAEITLTDDGLVTLQDAAFATFEFIRSAVGIVSDQLSRTFGPAIENVKKILISLIPTFNAVLGKLREFINQFIGGFVGIGRAIGAGLAAITTGNFSQIGSNAKEAFVSGFGTDFVGELGAIVLPAFDAVASRAREISLERIARDKKDAKAGVAGPLKAGAALGADGAANAVTPITDFQKVLNDLDKQAEILRLTNSERVIQNDLLQIENAIKRQLTPAEEALVQTRLENLQLLQQQADIMDEIRQPAQEFENRIFALNQLMKDGTITLEEFNLKLLELRQGQLELDQSFGSGLERGLLKVSEAATTLGDSVETFVVGGFRKASDALTEFATTGKLDFRGLISSMLSDLARLAAQQALAGLAGALIPGGAAAGAGGGIAGLLGFQNGGSFQVGGGGGADSQTVAFNATPGEQVSVMTPQQMSSMNQPVIVPPPTVQVINVSDPSEVPSAMDSPAGDEVFFNFIDRNSDAVKRRLS